MVTPSGPPLRVLILTKIFPNAAEPLSAPFNRQQFAALARLCEVQVLAAIPWFPGARAFRAWSAAGRLTEVPAVGDFGDLSVRHPRFLYLPRTARSLSGPLYAASLLPAVMAARRRVDVLLGSWAWPDGYAAVALGRLLGLPTVVKLHGSDMHVVAAMRGPRLGLRWALPRADRVVAVSDELVGAATALGVSRARITVVPNGVDRALFHPRDRQAARAALGLENGSQLILYVGRLERDKGVLDLIAAFARLAAVRSDVQLALVGDGAARTEAREASAHLGSRVIMAGPRPLDEVPAWMAAADVIALASWNEGLPNVLREAIACARPIVATRVGGVAELVTSPALGRLVPPRDPAAFAAALAGALDARERPPQPDGESALATTAGGGWDESARRLHAVLHAACAEHSRPRRGGTSTADPAH